MLNSLEYFFIKNLYLANMHNIIISFMWAPRIILWDANSECIFPWLYSWTHMNKHIVLNNVMYIDSTKQKSRTN